MQNLSELENGAVGLAAGCIEVTLLQSLNYAKTAVQTNLPLTLNPRVLYRGYASNVANMGGATGWQFATNGAIKKIFTGGQARQLSIFEGVILVWYVFAAVIAILS